MYELDTPYEKRDIVWARIKNYPWWPGKILEISQHKGSLFFKISFFADPTYCYVRQEDLISFQEFRQQMNSNYLISNQLKKAIILANNAFTKKYQTPLPQRILKRKSQNTKFQALQFKDQIYEDQPEKNEEFQQSTIDFEVNNSNGKYYQQKKLIQMENLLFKYKLHLIPKLKKFNEEKVESLQQPSSEIFLSQNQSEEQLFDLKSHRTKIIKKPNKKKPIQKKKRICKRSSQQKKVAFMKRLCALFISKSFESGISREIVVKIVQKTEYSFKSISNELKKIPIEEIYIKIINMVMRIDLSFVSESTPLQILNSIQVFIDREKHNLKEEQQKTGLCPIEKLPLESMP